MGVGQRGWEQEEMGKRAGIKGMKTKRNASKN